MSLKLDNCAKICNHKLIMGKFILLTGYFIVTPLFVLFTLLFLLFLSFQKNKSYNSFFSQQKSVAYAALPSSQNTFNDEIEQKDGRVENIRQFFAKYNSPLEPYAQNIIDAAEKYGIDYRLVPSIAMQESNLCKKIPDGSHNCWGYGIYGGKVTKFDNYPQAIETITKGLSKNYKGAGLETPEEIMNKYTPSSNGSWAKGVNHFMNKLQ